MQHPVEYVTALITVSVAFMAIAGIFIGIIGTKDKGRLRTQDRMIVLTSAISVIFGILAMVYAMAWYDQQNDRITTARYFLAFQFTFVYLPLYWYVLDVISVWFKRIKK